MAEHHAFFEGRTHAVDYAKFRPQTPAVIIKWINEYLGEKLDKTADGKFGVAVDVGCGTGQCTLLLAEHFERVHGSDVAESQIKQAIADNKLKNVVYFVSPAEVIPLPSNSVDLITCSQCFHWFDFDKFYAEIKRVLKPNGVLALITYIRPLLDHQDLKYLIRDAFHNQPLNKYVAEQLKMVDNGYADVHLPFNDVTRRETTIFTRGASGADILGYIRSWSSYNLCAQNEPEQATRLEQELSEKICKQTGKKVDEPQFCLETPFFLVMARK